MHKYSSLVFFVVDWKRAEDTGCVERNKSERPGCCWNASKTRVSAEERGEMDNNNNTVATEYKEVDITKRGRNGQRDLE